MTAPILHLQADAPAQHRQSWADMSQAVDPAADTRQSVPCGANMLNGNLIHFQSKRQKSVAFSSCEDETIVPTSILSEGVFLKGLLGRILGIEPKP